MLRSVVVVNSPPLEVLMPCSLTQVVNDRHESPAKYRATIDRIASASAGMIVTRSSAYPNGRYFPLMFGIPLSANS